MVLFLDVARRGPQARRVSRTRRDRGRGDVIVGRNEFTVVEALDEAALITDRRRSPLAANAAYVDDRAKQRALLGESDRPPMLCRLFGADPLLSAPMFRLSKAARQGSARREELPATTLHDRQARALRSERWADAGRLCAVALARAGRGARRRRAREAMSASSSSTTAPIGFFAARGDGTHRLHETARCARCWARR